MLPKGVVQVRPHFYLGTVSCGTKASKICARWACAGGAPVTRKQRAAFLTYYDDLLHLHSSAGLRPRGRVRFCALADARNTAIVQNRAGLWAV